MEFRTVFSLAVFLVCLSVTAAANEPELPKITPEQAREHVAKKVIVEMRVNASKFSSHHKLVYLDSKADFMDEDNLGVVLKEKALKALQAKGIESPADYYRDRKIRVTGLVVRREERLYLDVTKLDQLSLIEEQK